MDFEQVRSKVVDAGGIECFEMKTLRDASPYKKLGPGVNAEISEALKQKGLGHTDLQSYQEQTVFVYLQGSAAAQLMLAVTGTPSAEGADAIRRYASPDLAGKDAAAKLEEVRDLLVQLNDVFAEHE
jgi:hypothetical protein